MLEDDVANEVIYYSICLNLFVLQQLL